MSGPGPDAVAALCAAALPEEDLSAAELAHACFGEGDEHVGDDGAFAAYRLDAASRAAWLLLVAVHPGRQGRGQGRALVDAVAGRARAAGMTHLHLAAAIPRFLWPGVDLHATRAGMLFESCGFEPGAVALNMTIPTSFDPPAPAGICVEPERGDGALGLAETHYPHWVPELARAVGLGTAFAARAADGTTVGFGCHSVLRRGWIGPMATAPDLRARGIGSAVLGAVCADLAPARDTGEICWVANLRFYGKCGARVSRAFRGGTLRL